MKGIIKAICISEKRGTVKVPVGSAFVKEGFGIEGDAHGGKWHRQVSLLSADKVDEFNKSLPGSEVGPGAFGENLLIEGFDPAELPVGSIVKIGDVQIKITQIGKECHSHCEIYKRVGDCIMPRKGTFAEVITSGRINTGDEVTAKLPDLERPFTAAIITLSDKASKGEREDLSGPRAKEILEGAGFEVVETLVIPDEREMLEKELKRLSDRRQVELILTSGGTGFSHRDITPEATIAVADRNAPGIAEAIRYESMKYTNRAMLSRGASVIRGNSLIVNLPGSPKAVQESLDAVLEPLIHGLGILRGSAVECGRTDEVN